MDIIKSLGHRSDKHCFLRVSDLLKTGFDLDIGYGVTGYNIRTQK